MNQALQVHGASYSTSSWWKDILYLLLPPCHSVTFVHSNCWVGFRSVLFISIFYQTELRFSSQTLLFLTEILQILVFNIKVKWHFLTCLLEKCNFCSAINILLLHLDFSFLPFNNWGVKSVSTELEWVSTHLLSAMQMSDTHHD